MRLPAWVSWALVGIFVVSALGQIALLALPGSPEHGHRRLSGQALEAHTALLTAMAAFVRFALGLSEAARAPFPGSYALWILLRRFVDRHGVAHAVSHRKLRRRW